MDRRDVLRMGSLATIAHAVPTILSAAPKSTNATVSAFEKTAYPNITQAEHQKVWACWVGHSTVLLRIGESWVLTDPVLFSSYGIEILGITIGPNRISAPAIPFSRLPKIDLVLLSHAHLDHTDRKSLRALTQAYPNQIDVITAKNTLDIISDFAWNTTTELDWGENKTTNGLSISALEVKHNGWRLPGEPCRAAGQTRTGRSYNGYVIEHRNASIVFGGDTAYTNSFKHVPSKVDLAIMPIGAYEGCAEQHCTPEEALDMVQMMNAKAFMPIHHSTFKQSEEPVKEPLERLQAALCINQQPLLASSHVGESVSIL